MLYFGFRTDQEWTTGRDRIRTDDDEHNLPRTGRKVDLLSELNRYKEELARYGNRFSRLFCIKHPSRWLYQESDFLNRFRELDKYGWLRGTQCYIPESSENIH